MMADLGKLLRHNFQLLAEAGCKHIQIDEPLFTMADDGEVARRGRRHQHGDRGPARRRARLDPHLPGQLRRRQGIRRARSATAISTSAATRPTMSARSNARPTSIEYDMTHHYEGMLGDRQLGVGAVDVQDPKVESGETVAERIRKLRLAGAGADHRHAAPAASITCRAQRFRQAAGDGRSQTHSGRLRRERRRRLDQLVA